MKRLLTAAGALVCAFGSLFAHAQLTNITASSIGMGGVPIANGTVTFTPVNSSGIPIAFATGGGGLNAPTAFGGTITAGAIDADFQVPDACLTSPPNILYSVTITDTATHKTFTLQSVANVCGSSWALDHYGPPASTTNVQTIQIAYGTAAAPASCATPSLYIRNSSGGQLYICVAGHFVQVTGSGGAGYTPPTGDGFQHITAGAQDGAARAVDVSGADITGVLKATAEPAHTGDVTNSAGSLALTLATVNSNVGSCGDATHVGKATFDAKGRATACTAVTITGAGTVDATAMQSALSGKTGCTTAGYFWSPSSNTCLAASGGNSPSGAAGLYAWDGSAWVAATAAQVQAVLSSDNVNSSSVVFSTGSGGDSTCPAPASGKDELCMKSGQIERSQNGGAYAPLPTASTATSINALIQTLTGCSTATYLYNPSTGTCVAPSGGSSGPSMIVPRDINTHMVVADANTGVNLSSFYFAASTGVTATTAPDSAGFIAESLPTGTTANTDVGFYDVNKSVLAGKNPSFKTVFGLSTADNVNAWVGLCSFCSVTNVDHLDLGASNTGFVGFRHFSGTEATNWTCYASNWSGAAGSTMDSGVAVNTAQMQVFDVIYIAGVPHWYIGGVEKCAGLGATAVAASNVPDASAPLGAVDALKNTTTASVTGNMYKIYYGAN